MATDPVMNNMEVRAAAVTAAGASLGGQGIRPWGATYEGDKALWEPTPAMREVTAAIEYYIKNGYWKAT